MIFIVMLAQTTPISPMCKYANKVPEKFNADTARKLHLIDTYMRNYFGKFNVDIFYPCVLIDDLCILYIFRIPFMEFCL